MLAGTRVVYRNVVLAGTRVVYRNVVLACLQEHTLFIVIYESNGDLNAGIHVVHQGQRRASQVVYLASFSLDC